MSKILLIILSVFLALATEAVAQLEKESRKRGPDSYYYDAILVEGSEKSKQTIFFFWSAVDANSLEEFRTRIAPLLVENKTNVSIVISQVFDTRHHDLIGPGALLLCSDTYAAYANNALRYLQTASKVANISKVQNESGTIFYVNPTISTFSKSKLINLKVCEKNPRFYVRQTLLAAKTKKLFEKFGKQTLPFYVMNNLALSPKDPKVTVALRK